MLDLSHMDLPDYAVIGVGPTDSPNIMLVGEALGEEEVKQGEPFVGRSGQLLTRLMHRAGIARQSCYITNVVKVRPPRNKIKPYVDLGTRKREVPMSEEFLWWEEVLKEQIKQINPNIVIACGAVPLWTLCRQRGITKRRGSIIESTLVPGQKVIGCIHPSGALRQYIWQHYIAFDLERALEHSKTPDLPELDLDLILKPSFTQCMEYLEECGEANRVAFDIEVSRGEVSCISLSHSPTNAISIPFVGDKGMYFTRDQEKWVWLKIAAVLEDPNIEAIAHNAAFDATFLWVKYGIRTTNILDTMVAHGILYPDFPKRLEFLTTSYTLIPYYKDEGKSALKRNIDSGRALWRYNALDSIVLQLALPQLLADLERQGNLETFQNQNALIPVLMWMHGRGVRMDVEAMRELGREVGKELEKLQAMVEKIVGHEINLRGGPQVKNYFYKELRLKPFTKGGKPTMDKTALKRLASKGYKEASLILKYRELSKLKGTYLDAQMDEDDRLRCSFNPVGTKFGRLSSSKTIFGRGMNMQNQPKQMLQYFLVDEGYIGFSIDLAQAEGRVMAYISGDINMIGAYESGIDIHSRTASLIFGGPPSTDYQDSQIATSIGYGNLSQRQWGKKMNHALNYDMSANKASLDWEIPRKHAEALVEGYHNVYPGIRQYYRRVKDELRSSYTLENLYGRRYMFLGRMDDRTFKEAYAFVPQSTIADKTNREGLLFTFNSPELYKVELLNQVHDSILFQIPISVGIESIVKMLITIMDSLERPIFYHGRTFSIPVDIGVTLTNFHDIHEFSSAEVRGPVFMEVLEELVEFS